MADCLCLWLRPLLSRGNTAVSQRPSTTPAGRGLPDLPTDLSPTGTYVTVLSRDDSLPQILPWTHFRDRDAEASPLDHNRSCRGLPLGPHCDKSLTNSSQQSCDVVPPIADILQMGKPSLRGIPLHAWCQGTVKWRYLDLNLGFLTLKLPLGFFFSFFPGLVLFT